VNIYWIVIAALFSVNAYAWWKLMVIGAKSQRLQKQIDSLFTEAREHLEQVQAHVRDAERLRFVAPRIRIQTLSEKPLGFTACLVEDVEPGHFTLLLKGEKADDDGHTNLQRKGGT
jgi:hypothetical protein